MSRGWPPGAAEVGLEQFPDRIGQIGTEVRASDHRPRADPEFVETCRDAGYLQVTRLNGRVHGAITPAGIEWNTERTASRLLYSQVGAMFSSSTFRSRRSPGTLRIYGMPAS